jgi:hypothetical protein
MLNAGMVNATGVNAFHPDFREKNRALARIPRFRKFVKYKTNSRINHETAHSARPVLAGSVEMSL